VTLAVDPTPLVPDQVAEPDVVPRERAGSVEVVAALSVAFLLGVRYRFSPDVPVGFLAATAVLPVTVSVLRAYRGVPTVFGLTLLAAVSGVVLTWFAAGSDLADHSRAIVQTARVLGLGLGVMALLWARTVAGVRLTVATYAVGFVVGFAFNGIDPSNAWKFSLSVPVTLLVMSLPAVAGRPVRESVALIGLAGVSALNDSRSAAAMMLIAAVLVVSQGSWRRRAGSGRRRSSAVFVMVRLVLIAVAGFYLVQAAVLEGTLGEGAKLRTEEQIQTSGSVLVGGRPELGASIALVEHRPFGYGAGALASPTDVLTAKTGMDRIGYDPNNGYVEVYMLGDSFEVHSVLGDLWILFGFAGLGLALTILAVTVYGLAHALARRAATGVMLFLAIRTIWDFAFSPFPSAMETLMLALALVLPLTAAGRADEVGTSPQETPTSPAPKI